jgi:4-diphosphocytidyl-2-C-methyl-D-erythritol kinase
MNVLAPAKINLHLRVGRRRDDGFHPLLTWMCAVGLFDILTIDPAATPVAQESPGEPAGPPAVPPSRSGAPTVVLRCDRTDLPRGEDNLVVKVAQSFAAEVPGSRPVCIALTKRIPVGAGLGGGSSDAAATLAGLNRLWGADWPADRLSAFAARFGSDVPFFFHGPSSACRGRGEFVRPVPAPKAAWALLAMPPFGLATRDVYGRFDETGLGDDDALAEAREPDWDEWSRLGARDLLARVGNDLEPAAFSLSPPLAALREALERRLGRPVRMSGSGSTLFTLYDAAEEADAKAAAGEVSDADGTRAEVVSVARASGIEWVM